MAKNFNLNDYMYDDLTGKFFHSESGNFVRNKQLLQQLQEAHGKPIRNTKTASKAPGARSLQISRAKQYSKYFSKGTKFTTSQGHLKSWAKPLSLRGGKAPEYNWSRVEYRNSNGIKTKTNSKNYWGADVNKNSMGPNGGAMILNGTKEWVRQLQISIYSLHLQAENFRVMATKRALKVFQNSFKYQRFYSKTGKDWPSLSPFTKKMRTLRETGFHILKEYDRLYKSIQIDPTNKGRIETKPVYISQQWQTGKKSKLTQTTIKKVVFAGYHNEGRGHHGPISTHYKKRQFMGHSSYLNPFTDSFMKKMMKIYLFDSVFLVKKA